LSHDSKPVDHSHSTDAPGKARSIELGVAASKETRARFIDPMELLRMINGKTVPTSAVIQGHAKELGSDVRYLQNVAAEIKRRRRLHS
jgi:hypothetical protein